MYVAEEARRNLLTKAPDGLKALDDLLARIKVAGVQISEPMPQAALKVPEKDRPVLAAAVALGCDVLVTGDKTHFGAFYGKSLGGVTIHSPRSLAEAARLSTLRSRR